MYCSCLFFFFFKQKTAYEMRISDWSSDVCSSDLLEGEHLPFARDECFDLGQWRARTNCEDKLGRVIVDDAQQPGRAEDRGIARRAEIGRASCRERVCQYV